MRTLHSLLASFILPLGACAQFPCDSLIHAAFSAVPVSGNTVHFQNTSFTAAPNATSYFWSFGDGGTSTNWDPLHTYGQPGSYTVCLALISGNCFDSTCTSITIGNASSPCDGLDAGFQVTTQGLEATFHDNNPPNGQHSLWSFGDGTSGDGPSPTHHYPATGQYHACLTVWTWDPLTQDTCYADHCEWVSVQGPAMPCDSLNATFSVMMSGLVAHFAGNWDPPGLTYHWSYGDGTGGNGPTSEHAYAQPDTYMACLTVFDPQSPDSCKLTSCQPIIVQGGGTPCDGLDAGFQVTTQGPVATFHTNPGNAGQHYIWHFGDGSTGDAPTPVHTYPQSGQYHACLLTWAWNPLTQDTCYADHCEWVTILGGNGSPCDSLNAGFQVTTQGPVASFHTNPGNAGQHYIWHFGDGTTGDAPTPIHTYPQPGQYHACLLTWAWNPLTQDTCYADHCEWVTILGGNGSPCDSLNAGFQVTTQGSTALFHNNTGNPNQAYLWSFGDGTSGDGSMPSHTYAAPGQYHACLLVWTWDPATQDTCYADHCEWVTIQGGNGSPCDSLDAGFQVVTQGLAAYFHNHSINPAQLYVWSFGDGNMAYGAMPVHPYPGPGVYEACLTTWAWNATTQDTCYAEHCEQVTILPGGTPCDSLNASGFGWSAQNGVIDLWSPFPPNSTNASYIWTVDSVAFAWGPQATYQPSGPDPLTICLTSTFYAPDQTILCTTTSCETIQLELIQGIADPAGLADMGSYPQPFSDLLTVGGKDLQGLLRFTLMDMAGRVVDDRQETVQGSVVLNYASVSTGPYLLRVRSAQGEHTLHILKQ